MEEDISAVVRLGVTIILISMMITIPAFIVALIKSGHAVDIAKAAEATKEFKINPKTLSDTKEALDIIAILVLAHFARVYVSKKYEAEEEE